MNANAAIAVRRDFRSSLRLEAVCEFSAVRAAVLIVRDWLAEKGLPEADLGAWELALAEAVNNAVKYAPPAARELPVTLEISCGERDVEARITDHTGGFDWPADVKLPDVESESGRGLFLMKSLTDSVAYLRGTGQNVLILRRAWTPSPVDVQSDPARLQARLAEAEVALNEMTSELASCYESLVAMFRYSAELGRQTDVKEFSRRILHDLLQISEADFAVLRLVSADGGNLETSLVLPEAESIVLPPLSLADERKSVEIRAAKHRLDVWFDPKEPLSPDDPLAAAMLGATGICHAFYVADQLVGTATLGRRTADKPFSAARVNLLHTFIDFLAIQIVNARLLDERTAAQVTRRELEIGAQIQRSLQPETIPACPPFELSATSQNALQVGGDFFDIIPAENGAVLLVIADVMGKGVPAALFAAILRSTIRSMPQLFARPGELLTAANRTLYSDLSRVDMFATAQVAYLNPAKAELISANAGHCPPLWWHSNEPGGVAIKKAGFPIGIEPDVVYAQSITPLPRGALALLYTDGLSEARNAEGQLLGEEKLLELLAQSGAKKINAEATRKFLLGRIAEFCGAAPLSDDQTVILIRHAS